MKKRNIFKRFLCVLAVVSMLFSLGLTAFAEGSANTAKVTVDFSPQGTGAIEFIRNGTTKTARSKTSYSNQPVGREITLKAVETDAEFLYWKDSKTNRVLSFNDSYTFVLASNTSVYAVFASHTAGNHNVVYLNYAGVELLYDEIALGASFAVPTDTYLPGFTFVGWDKSYSEVKNDTDHVIVRPIYRLNTETFTVALTNSEGVSGAGSYDLYETVKISADKTDANGAAFSYWKDANNHIVSFDRVYKFKINYNASFTAVYGETVTAEPLTRITGADASTEHGKITFYAERSVPKDDKVVEHGILLTDSASIATGTAFTVDNSNVLKRKGTTVERLGLYSLAKKSVSAGDTWYARSYVICDIDGAQYIYYSDVYSQTL